nr:response regulator [Roseomonas acroporae]
MRVLVAEDEGLAAMTIEDVLAQQGYEVLVAYDGQEALELAERATFDVLLTDLRMPRLGGEELIRRLRARDPRLPVVVMTGSPPTGGVASLQRPSEGPMELLEKPMAFDMLVDALQRVTRR